jgi:hypothetical protein
MDPLQSPKIWEIASALHLPVTDAPAVAILSYCERRAAKILTDFPDCTNPAELLDIMAAMLGTSFEEIHSDDGLLELRDRYCRAGEFGFASLHKDLDIDAFGVTYRRIAATLGERAFVSVIDCRGNKSLRSYFTKWHELGHLLILTNQQTLSFRRTHSEGTRKDPEESLVDLIAGHMGFYPRFLLPEMQIAVSFGEVDRIRAKLFPEASFQASANAYTKHHSEPCLLIEAKLALKVGEKADLSQETFDFIDPPTPKLRVHSIIASASAKKNGLYIPKNFRVPEASIVHGTFLDGRDHAIAQECLSLWDASGGKRLKPMPIRVEVRQHFNSVLVIISCRTAAGTR